jgi:hypothetical protein
MLKAGFHWSMLQTLKDDGLLVCNKNRLTKNIRTSEVSDLLPLNAKNNPTISIRCIGLRTSSLDSEESEVS